MNVLNFYYNETTFENVSRHVAVFKIVMCLPELNEGNVLSCIHLFEVHRPDLVIDQTTVCRIARKTIWQELRVIQGKKSLIWLGNIWHQQMPKKSNWLMTGRQSSTTISSENLVNLTLFTPFRWQGF